MVISQKIAEDQRQQLQDVLSAKSLVIGLHNADGMVNIDQLAPALIVVLIDLQEEELMLKNPINCMV